MSLRGRRMLAGWVMCLWRVPGYFDFSLFTTGAPLHQRTSPSSFSDGSDDDDSTVRTHLLPS